jgi:hypothetical protein
MSNYYYILSALPQLSLENTLQESDLDEAWSLIKRNASKDDLEQINWFLRRNDLYNLLESWQHRYLSYPYRPLRKPYSLSRKEVSVIDKDPALLDPIFHEFYQRVISDMPHWSANEMDRKWFRHFFNKVDAEAKAFISDLFSFERYVRSLMATFNQGVYSFVNKDIVYTDELIRSQLIKGNIQLSERQKLSQPFLESLLKALATKDPLSISNAVHLVLWEKADELAYGHYFDQFALLNYCSKLFLIYRREQFSQNQKKPFLKDLLEAATKDIKQHD